MIQSKPLNEDKPQKSIHLYLRIAAKVFLLCLAWNKTGTVLENFLLRCPELMPWYTRLLNSNPERAHLVISTIVAQIHAVVQSIWAVAKISFYSKTMASNSTFGALMLSYLINDLWKIRKSIAPDILFHHISGIAMCIGFFLFNDSEFFHFIPKLMMVELSTVFLNTSWLLRESGATSGIFATIANM
jgi:hypothetical protein